jgi:hypothetical protein
MKNFICHSGTPHRRPAAALKIIAHFWLSHAILAFLIVSVGIHL